MADGIRIDTKGFRDLEKSLLRLEKKAARKLLRKAVTRAAAIPRKDARSRAPAETGTLKKSLGVIYRTYKRAGGGTRTAIIGPRTGFGQSVVVGGKSQWRDPVKYAHLVEYGTAPHVLASGRQHPGTSPRPFMRPAFDNNVNAMIRKIGDVLGNGIEAEATKVSK